MRTENTKEQFLRFAGVGILSTAVNYGAFLVLFKSLGFNYLLSSALGYISGLVFGFGINKHWTFKSDGRVIYEFPIYFGVYLFSLLVSLTFLKVLVDYMEMDALIANGICIVITTILNFIGTKVLAFKK